MADGRRGPVTGSLFTVIGSSTVLPSRSFSPGDTCWVTSFCTMKVSSTPIGFWFLISTTTGASTV